MGGVGEAKTQAFVRRKCCPGGDFELVEPLEVERSLGYAFHAEAAPVLGEIEEPDPDERVCWHEAGHAVIGHGFGAVLASVTVRSPAHVEFVSSGFLLPVESVAMSYAGPVGEMARTRCWSTFDEADEADFLARVEAFQFGGCDGCRMALAAWAAVGLPAGIDAARGVFREGQLLALRIAQERRVRQAIQVLAKELLERHTVSGKRAASIIEPFVRHGEFSQRSYDV